MRWKGDREHHRDGTEMETEQYDSETKTKWWQDEIGSLKL
jgi:hypothetical protein